MLLFDLRFELRGVRPSSVMCSFRGCVSIRGEGLSEGRKVKTHTDIFFDKKKHISAQKNIFLSKEGFSGFSVKNFYF